MSEPSVNVSRSEWKYYIGLMEYHYLKQLLSDVMTPDPHMGYRGEYYIRSLYFDSIDNYDYMSKLSGLKMRKKIRLRIYGKDDEKVKLEIKNRMNMQIYKESLAISKSDALEIIEGNPEVLLGYESSVAIKAYNTMKGQLYLPKTIVDYEREAFLYPEGNVRITFDKNIRAVASDRLFDDELLLTPLIREPVMVLEVKYDRNLPDVIKNAISSARILNSSISKYCMSRELLG